MPHCTKCGAMVADNAGFCPNCGAAQAGTGGVASSSVMTQTGMKENVAGLLCYVLGWVTGLIFFFIDKRSFVQFHAKQSIVIFGGLQLIGVVVGMAFRTQRNDRRVDRVLTRLRDLSLVATHRFDPLDRLHDQSVPGGAFPRAGGGRHRGQNLREILVRFGSHQSS